MFVVDRDFFSAYVTLALAQALCVTEAVISVTLLYQLFCVFQVQTCCITLALYVRAAAAVFVRAFIVNQSGLFQGAVDDLSSALYITLLVGIFNTEDKISVLVFCNKICIECCTKIADVHSSCRARCKSGSDFCHRSFLPFKM